MTLGNSPPDSRAPRPTWPIFILLAFLLFTCLGSVALVSWGVVTLIDEAEQGSGTTTGSGSLSKSATTPTGTSKKS